MARDVAGNVAAVQTRTYTIDKTPPTVTANLATGIYNITQNITLTATDNVDSSPFIYYTTNGSTPTTSSTRYISPITIFTTTTLKFIARDSAGNVAAVQTRTYTMDNLPIVTTNLRSGVFNTTQNVTLIATDDIDPNPVIYYTTNGNTPTTSSTRYTTPISIFATTTLKFMARDSLGNQSPIQTVYYIFSPVGNINTGKGYNSIQAAVNDSLTSNGHIIEVRSGTYTENIVVNKKLVIKPISNGDVTVQAVDPSLSVFTVNSGGSGSIIQGFTIVGANQTNELGEPLNPAGIHLKSADNCTIINNTIKNNYYGVYLLDSSYNQVDGNFIMDNANGVFVPAWCVSFEEYYSSYYLSDPEIFDYVWWEYNEYCFGMHSDSFYNRITQNSIRNNTNGFYITSDLYGASSGSETIQILENDITSNDIGIYADTTNANIHFNRIIGNNNTGLFMYVGAVDATNNWWGSNSPVLNTNYNGWTNSDTCDIYYKDYESSRTSQPPSWILLEKFTPYLVLKVNPTSHKVSNGKVYESTITADLTHNSNGEDTSPQGRIPDGIPVDFVSQYGIITTPLYTRNGKASSTLVLDPNVQLVTGVIAVVDDEGVYTGVDWLAQAVTTVMSGAIDTSTNDLLNFNYTLPLNSSTAWVSVLWKETGLFRAQIDLIVNGNVVVRKNVVNAAYLTYKGSYSAEVFNQISYINGLFLNPVGSTTFVPNQYLQMIIDANHLENLTVNQLEDFILFGVKQQYNFTNNEIAFIKNNRRYFVDFVVFGMSYPGDAAQTISFVDPDNNETLSINFPGNPIVRISPMIYFNGYTEDGNAGYEGVKSFAIATTKVTDSILQYWLDKKSLYAPGAMKAAYGTFLASLLVIKAHDMVADQAASEFNVTWSRTTPVMVSVVDDAASTYMTGEMDHRMGMDVVGDEANVWAFRFACSAAFSPLENEVMDPDSIGSVTMGIGERILQGQIPELFYSNGYIIYKIQNKDDLILILDPETGIVRDVANGISGVYCFHDQITDHIIEQAENMSSDDPDARPESFNKISKVSILIGVIGTTVVQSAGFALSYVVPPVLLIMAPIIFLDAIQPYAIEEAEQNGMFNTAEYLRNNNLLDQMWDVMLQSLGIGGPPQGVWDESNEYIIDNKNVLRNLEDINNLKEETRVIWDGISDLLLESESWSVKINLSPIKVNPDGTFEEDFNIDQNWGTGGGGSDPGRLAKFLIWAMTGFLILSLPLQLYYDNSIDNETNDLEVNVTNENGTTVIRISSNRMTLHRS